MPRPAGSPANGTPTSGPAASGPAGFTVSGGGDVVVDSDAMIAQLERLSRFGETLHVLAGELVAVIDGAHLSFSGAPNIPARAVEARRTMDASLRLLRVAKDRAATIHGALTRSLDVYASTEDVEANLLHRVGEEVAWGLGLTARVFALPLAFGAGEAMLAAYLLTRGKPGEVGGALQLFLRNHGRILTSPLAVAVIREAAADVDGFGAGFAGVPPAIADVIESLGLTNVKTSAAGVVELGRSVGLLTETGVTVKKTSSFEFGSPPKSLLDRANSFPDPHGDPNGEQIRIDRYVEQGKPDRFDVYISGTVTFDPKTQNEAFDFTSDLTGVAQESPGSYRAVREAMSQAGITPNSPVVLNGYSQGGLIASLVASSGDYNVKGVVTFGAPSAQVQIPASIPVLTVRNTEDLVPATSGYDVNPNAIVVQRTLFADRPVPTDWVVPAHRLSYYQETAAVIDSAKSGRVRTVLDSLGDFGAGADRVDSTLWVAERTHPHDLGQISGAVRGAVAG